MADLTWHALSLRLAQLLLLLWLCCSHVHIISYCNNQTRWLCALSPTVECALLVAGEKRSRRERLAQLLDFATEHFLNDAELAQQHAQNLLIEGLYSEQYWVSNDSQQSPAASALQH